MEVLWTLGRGKHRYFGVLCIFLITVFVFIHCRAEVTSNSNESDSNPNVVIENWLNELETSTDWEDNKSNEVSAPDFLQDSDTESLFTDTFSPEYMKLKKEFTRKVKRARGDGKRIRVQLLKMVILGYSWSGLAKSCKTSEELLQKTRVASALTLLASALVDYKTQKFIRRLNGVQQTEAHNIEIAQQSFIGYWRGKTPVLRSVSRLKHDASTIEFTRRASVAVALLGAILSVVLQRPTLMYVSCAMSLARYMGEPLVLAAIFGKGNKIRRPLLKPGRIATLLGSPHYSSNF